MWRSFEARAARFVVVDGSWPGRLDQRDASARRQRLSGSEPPNLARTLRIEPRARARRVGQSARDQGSRLGKECVRNQARARMDPRHVREPQRRARQAREDRRHLRTKRHRPFQRREPQGRQRHHHPRRAHCTWREPRRHLPMGARLARLHCLVARGLPRVVTAPWHSTTPTKPLPKAPQPPYPAAPPPQAQPPPPRPSPPSTTSRASATHPPTTNGRRPPRSASPARAPPAAKPKSFAIGSAPAAPTPPNRSTPSPPSAASIARKPASKLQAAWPRSSRPTSRTPRTWARFAFHDGVKTLVLRWKKGPRPDSAGSFETGK